jgi:hypothetical protein
MICPIFILTGRTRKGNVKARRSVSFPIVETLASAGQDGAKQIARYELQ